MPEGDDVGGPDQILAGFGGTMRDGLGVRAERGGVELAIVGGLLLDPVLGVRRTSIGIADGRIVAVGRAGNPDTMDGIDVVLGPGDGGPRRDRADRHARRRSTRTCTGSRRRSPTPRSPAASRRS